MTQKLLDPCLRGMGAPKGNEHTRGTLLDPTEASLRDPDPRPGSTSCLLQCCPSPATAPDLTHLGVFDAFWRNGNMSNSLVG